MSDQQTRFTYDFGDFRIDPQRRVLFWRTSGDPVQVTGKVFDTLLYLVAHAGELLEKRTLMEALWPQVVVEEGNLTQTIHTLRRVLGERPGEHRYIVTVPGRGYRFVASVSQAPVDHQEAAHPSQPVDNQETAVPSPSVSVHVPLPRRTIAIALAIVVVAIIGSLFLLTKPASIARPLSADLAQPTVSLAVLPFVDMSREQDQTYFADGLAEEILNLLAQSSSMRIIARTSSFSFKDRRDLDVETIARKLHATHVLEGSVRKSGKRLRVTAQLVDATTSAHLWSHTYDRDLVDVFQVQDEIAAAVTDSLHARLDNGKSVARSDTTSEQAFEQYLNGRYFFNRRGESDLARAKRYFEKALEFDPAYASAWAGLGATYYAAFESGQPIDAQSQQAWQKAVERALSLGPGIAEVHVRAAQYYWWRGEWLTSDEHCKVAIALNPSDAVVLGVSASKAIGKGHLQEALALQRRTVAVDPLSPPNRFNLGSYLALAGEFEAAVAEYQRAKELSPTMPGIDLNIAYALILQKRFDEALEHVEQEHVEPLRAQGLALVYYGLGNTADGDAAFADLMEMASADSSLTLRVAEVHAFRGDNEQAVKGIEQALASSDSKEIHAAIWARFEILRSPFLGSLREHGRLQPLLANAQRREELVL